jgi:hypothetical protein
MEGKDASDAAKTKEKLKAPFPVLYGKDGAWRERYDYLHAYVIDAEGVVRAVFPGTVPKRPSGETIADAFETIIGEK